MNQPTLLPAHFPVPVEPNPTTTQTDLSAAVVCREIQAELERAQALFPNPQHSAREGFAVLLEEVDELKAHVWANQSQRDLAAMRKEAVQVAAMAARFIIEVCDGGRGRV